MANIDSLTTLGNHVLSQIDASTPTEQTNHLLILPSEIRLMIYNHLVIALTILDFLQWLTYYGQPDHILKLGSTRDILANFRALTLTCRKVYDEIKHHFYTDTVFASYIKQTTPPSGGPLHTMSDAQIGLIRHLVLYRVSNHRFPHTEGLVCHYRIDFTREGKLEKEELTLLALSPDGRFRRRVADALAVVHDNSGKEQSLLRPRYLGVARANALFVIERSKAMVAIDGRLTRKTLNELSSALCGAW